MKLFTILKFNKYFLIFIFIVFFVATGSTYAYYAYLLEEESVLVGSVVGVDVDLDVELVVGNNNDLVPLKTEALSNALIGEGSSNGSCIDNVGNLSCQVYKITLNNKGSRVRHINGTIELFPKEGAGNSYTNLKWQELTTLTTIKEDAIINGMKESLLVSNITMESKEIRIWYIAVWLEETNSDQLNIDKGDFEGIVRFESSKPSFVTTTLKANSTSDDGIDFSKTSKETNTNGIFFREDTKNNPNPIYFYRGIVDNNLIFADFCWKIVRTTETGGLKLVYNGVPNNGVCNNTGTSSQIGTSKFNELVGGVGHVGYMYHVDRDGTEVSLNNTAYYYGSDVSYSNGIYTLTNPVFTNDWNTFRNSNDGANTHHYTCLSNGITCNEVYYIYRAYDDRVYYYIFYNGEKIEEYLIDVLGSDEIDSAAFNVKSSTIKNNIDSWYSNNIDKKGYTSYLEDTVWCGDRTIEYKAGLEPAYGNVNHNLIFKAFSRTNGNPNLSCTRRVDRFTVSTVHGNGNLDYPVGLLTMDEMMLAGGLANMSNDSYYLYTGERYWSMSPGGYLEYCFGSYIDVDGMLKVMSANSYYGIRPSISLKEGYSISNGDGTTINPYIVDINND